METVTTRVDLENDGLSHHAQKDYSFRQMSFLYVKANKQWSFSIISQTSSEKKQDDGSQQPLIDQAKK